MNKTQRKAEQYFSELWQREQKKIITEKIAPAVLKDGATYPLDFCVSTIARVILQPLGAQAIRTIQIALSKLLDASNTQFIYLPESLHISLVGCTQKENSPDTFSEEHIGRINSICEKVIPSHQYVDVVLKGIGLTGNQIFIQCTPIDQGWEALRTNVTNNLENGGEYPISYPNKAPIHMNIIRITDASSEKLKILRELIEGLRDIEIGTVRFANIELVVTDFVLSKNNFTSLKQYYLKDND